MDIWGLIARPGTPNKLLFGLRLNATKLQHCGDPVRKDST